MYLKPYLILLITALVLGCGTSSKNLVMQKQVAELDSLIAKKNFVIQSDKALPLMTTSMNSVANSGLFPPGSMQNQVSLSRSSNYLKIIGDSVAADLPYFGERQMGGGYNGNNGGIVFKGIPKKYEVIKNDKRQGFDIRFAIRNASESFNVQVALFPNRTSSINVTSSQRTAIRYEGVVSSLEEDSSK